MADHMAWWRTVPSQFAQGFAQSNALDERVCPVERHRAITAVIVCLCIAPLYAYGWGDGIQVAIRDLTGGAGPARPGMVTVYGQSRHLIDNLLLTSVAAMVFLLLRWRACGFVFVPDGRSLTGTGSALRWRRWWRTGFAYCWCMLAGFASIDLVSAIIRTPFYDYPFAARYENDLAAMLYCINMFLAGPTEELVLLGIVVIGLRYAGAPWWLVTCVAVGLRVPFHLYYGWAAFAIAVWPVLAVLLYRRMGMITPLIVAHGMYDVSTAMTNLTGVAGSSWPRVLAFSIMAMPVVWAVAFCIMTVRELLRHR
ncbi:CPBP family intramembrane metalloprotease [Bifidobacterium callitrichos]|uniref:CPBP family intramembrane metalloprotease n=1 Tax=Bifidobacterium callitrichos TaxID=762209 RepID=A0A5M9ZDV1_9BIFI|nr:CPBP family glutamic-type intramembrane protease [Bifidobacterium callitrichos]KAA8817208.1 CPBP family intramembrane metalloprotease [Bifidobacterium callitrichos]